MPSEAQTPAARWRDEGKDDPHGTRYMCSREQLSGGHLTDDELANEVFIDPSMANLTAAKDRIRWLSRQNELLNVHLAAAKNRLGIKV